MKVTLTFDTADLFNSDWLPYVDQYFQGKLTALEACKLIGCDRSDWEVVMSSLISATVRRNYESNPPLRMVEYYPPEIYTAIIVAWNDSTISTDILTGTNSDHGSFAAFSRHCETFLALKPTFYKSRVILEAIAQTIDINQCLVKFEHRVSCWNDGKPTKGGSNK